MKIGLVCPYNITRGGGVQEVVRHMYSELSLRGHTVKIITPEPLKNNGEDLGDEILFLGGGADLRTPTHTSGQFSFSIDRNSISQALDKENFDILHFHEPWVPMLSRQILTRSKAINIATFHAVIPETLVSRSVIKAVTPYSQSIIKYLHELTAVSQPATEYIKSLTDMPISIIPNGIDLRKYHAHRYPKLTSKTLKTVLYVGRLERRKGAKYLIKAFKYLTDNLDNVQLIIAGDGPDREKLEKLTKDLRLNNVHFVGYVSETEKLELIKNSSLFCSPAVYGESFGIVLLESMASGLVTVCGNNSGYSALMKDIGAISVVNPHETEEFARRMKLLLEENDIRKIWQNWAVNYVKQFDWPKVVDQYEKLYFESIQKHTSK